MDEMKVKRFVAEKLHEGIKLTDIQTLLVEELDCKMTFLELRLLAAELEDVDWAQFDSQEKAASAPSPAPAENTPMPMPSEAASNTEADTAKTESTAEAENPSAAAGTTTVELSRLTRPGALAHGTVNFASGATAEWLVDELGRLGLDKVSGQPTENDLVEFQNELRKLFERR